MCFGYKLRLASTSSLSKDIQEKAATLKHSRAKIKKLNNNLNPLFGKLKKAKAELTKFEAQEVKLKEKEPRLKDVYAEKEADLKDISSSIIYDIVNILKEIDSIAIDMKKIIFDADTILYRESRTIDKLHKKIKGMNLAKEINNKLILVKEDMKTAARRLYESVEAQKALKKPFKKRKKILISKKIKKLSTEAGELEGLLEKLKLTNIDEITKDAEKELDDLEKIEFAVVSLAPELKSHIIHIKSKLYLLDAGRIEEKLNSTERKLNKILSKISSQAEKLFEEIVIVEKI